MRHSNIDIIVEVQKFNPYHDSRGRFATANGATSFTYAPGKSKAHDNAIAREKERTSAAGGAKAMTNPTGDYKKDREKEWDGADCAVQFTSDGKGYNNVDLHSDAKTHDGGSWAESAYGNMKIYTSSGRCGQIYMMSRKSAQAAMNAANTALRNGTAKTREEAIAIMQREASSRSLRTVNSEYIAQQRKAAMSLQPRRTK